MKEGIPGARPPITVTRFLLIASATLVFLLSSLVSGLNPMLDIFAATTGSLGDTIIPTLSVQMHTTHNISAILPEYRLFTLALPLSTVGNVKIFSKTGQLRLYQSTNTLNTKEVNLKQSMKLFISTFQTTVMRQVSNVQVSASTQTFAATQTLLVSTGEFVSKSLDLVDTNYILLVSVSKIWQIDVSLLTETLTMALPEITKPCIHLADLSAKNAFLIGKNETTIPILTKTGYISAGSISLGVGEVIATMLADNLNSGNFVYMIDTTFKLTSRELTGYTTTATLVLPLSRASKLINTGPFQLMMLIPPDSFSPQIMFINKPTISVDTSQPIYLFGAVSTAMNIAGLIFQDDKAYFSIVNMGPTSIQNFQSYMFVLDPCTTRDSQSVCQDCLPGYYRDSLLQYNRCFSVVNFKTGYGIDKSTNAMLKPCVDPFCTNCVDDYTSCKSCDSSVGTFLMENKCQPFITVTVMVNPYKREFAAVSALVNLTSTGYSSFDMKQVTADYAKALQLNISAQDANTKLPIGQSGMFNTSLSVIQPGLLVLDIFLSGGLEPSLTPEPIGCENRLDSQSVQFVVSNSNTTEKVYDKRSPNTHLHSSDKSILSPRLTEVSFTNFSSILPLTLEATADQLDTAGKLCTFTFVRHGSEYLSNIRSPTNEWLVRGE